METPQKSQRIGAYGLITRPAEILLTRISPLGFPAGHWALPGGAIDHGEPPIIALQREIHEETGLEVVNARLLDVHDVHTVDRGRDDKWEDYHGIHLVYRVEVAGGTVPHVVEAGGTTETVEWIAWEEVPRLPILPVVAHVLARRQHYGLTSR